MHLVNSAFYPSGVGKWVPASTGKAKAGMVHSVNGWMRGVQVKLWNPLRTHAIAACLRGVFTTRCYTNPSLLYLTLPCWSPVVFVWFLAKHFTYTIHFTISRIVQFLREWLEFIFKLIRDVEREIHLTAGCVGRWSNDECVCMCDSVTWWRPEWFHRSLSSWDLVLVRQSTSCHYDK